MISAGERIAYYRCPANSVLWSSNPECRGKFAGKLETVQLKVCALFFVNYFSIFNYRS